MRSLFIGNLPFTASEDEIRALFAAYGTVESIRLITNRDTGEPRGFGFVEMPDNEASRAIHELNGKDFGGRALRINAAEPRTQNRSVRRW